MLQIRLYKLIQQPTRLHKPIKLLTMVPTSKRRQMLPIVVVQLIHLPATINQFQVTRQQQILLRKTILAVIRRFLKIKPKTKTLPRTIKPLNKTLQMQL